MANDTAEPGTQLQPAQPRHAPRPVMVVEDTVPIFDTARFEHYGRIAAVMANASLVPTSLRGGSREEAVANCFMVVAYSDRMGVDPFAAAQCASVVSGKLMWEGKFVAAVIKSKLGLDLHYHFDGERGKDDYRVYVSDQPFTEEIVAQLSPGKPPVGLRVIDGSVGEWKTGNDNWKKQPDMQLRYRGARVWCRAYEPSIMLGVYTEDELEELREEREAAPMRGDTPRLSAGFGDETDRDFRAQGAAQTAEAASGSTPADESSEATGAAAEAESDPKPKPKARKGSARAAAPEPEPEPEAESAGEEVAEESAKGEATSTESQPSSDDSPAETVDHEAQEEEPETTAPAGEVYLIVGEGYGEDGRRKSYKDGKPFSTVTEKGASKLPVYDHHAPLPEEDDFPGDRQGEPGKKAEAQKKASAPSGDGDESPFGICHAKVNEAVTWLAIKQHLRTLAKTEAWGAAEDEGKRMIRMVSWERYVDLRDTGKDTSDPAEDLSLFRLWLEFGAEDKEAVDGLFRVLYRSQAYREASEADRKALGDLIEKRKGDLPSAA